MLHLVLHQPEIPPNTGNVIRLAANTGMTLHLIRPLGFELDDTRMKRAGLDYHEFSKVQVHENFEAFCETVQPNRIWVFSTHAKRFYHEVSYAEGDALLFGSETRGLPQALRESFDPEQLVRIPMQACSRSLNLSNSVAIAAYEAWRQLGFFSVKK